MGETEQFKWPGIANGSSFTIEQKRQQRNGADMPEDNQIQWAAMFNMEAGLLSTVWRLGFIDLCTLADGKGAASMTVEQSDHWKRVRGH